MTDTSNQYDFVNNETIVDFVTDAYEKCGVIFEQISGYQLKSAQRSMNYVLSNWVNRGLNLWAVDQQMITLVPNQNTYDMPTGTIDIVDDQCCTLNIQRQITTTGVADASEGVAANAFDGDPATACTQTLPNGWISYDLGAGNNTSIPYIGIVSFIDNTYTLSVEYSNDGNIWYEYNSPETLTYLAGNTVWIVPYKSPNAQYFRISETGGSILDINEIYFSTPLNSKIITRLSRQEWIALPNKNVLGNVNAFVVQRQINPIIQFWNTPSSNSGYTNVLYYRSRSIQDVSNFIQNADVPQRFFMAFSDALAAELSLKFAPDKYQLLKMRAEESYSLAARADVEKVPVRMDIDSSVNFLDY